MVAVTDSFGDWTPITVHLTGEVSARNRTTPYKGSMFAVYSGDIVFSKIDARNGAIGVLPSEISKAVVTSEFPVLIPIPDRLHSEFVKLVLRTGGFLSALRVKASGTSGRKRITPEALLDLRIPLPPLDEQRTIAAAYRAGQRRAVSLEQEAEETETRAMEAFEEALGFGSPTPLPDRPVFVASFKDLDRWSHEGILRQIVETHTTHTSPYPIVHLCDVIADLENGWSPRCHDQAAEDNEWGVLKLGAVSFGVFNPKENKALPKHLKPRPHLEVKPGQLLISRANITRLVGVTALISETRPKLMLCDKIFRFVTRQPAPVDVAFLKEILRISDVRRQIEANVTGTSPTMKNISKPALMGLTFPLPAKNEQVTMTTTLADARARATDLRGQARTARAQAWRDFEASVYAVEDETEAADLKTATPARFSISGDSTAR